MSDLDDIHWLLERQSRALQDALADARLVWRDANARAAEQRFLQPRAEAEATVLTTVAAQHAALKSAMDDLRRAEDQRRVAADESAHAVRSSEQSGQAARSALNEAGAANDQAAQADQLAASARNCIGQAAAAGGG
jgi:hypothetical protein